jgi:hypothetical protein
VLLSREAVAQTPSKCTWWEANSKDMVIQGPTSQALPPKEAVVGRLPRPNPLRDSLA